MVLWNQSDTFFPDGGVGVLCLVTLGDMVLHGWPRSGEHVGPTWVARSPETASWAGLLKWF